jgi:ELWxxDGT repeat protein
MTAVRTLAWFSAYDSATGQELWVTDGTAAGTRVLDLVPGSPGSNAVPLAEYDGALLFAWDDGVHGTEVWATTGSIASTVRLTDLPGTTSSWSLRLLRIGLDRFVFEHDDGVHGREPWTLTLSGASLVLDVVSGPESSLGAWLGTAGEDAYFRTPDDELWRTDGTAAGTVRLMTGLDTTDWFDVVAGRVYFDHDDGVLGHEPWVVTAGATAEIVGAGCGVGMRAPWLESSDPVLGRTWVVRGGGGPPGSVGLLVLGRPAVRPDLLPGGCTSFVDAGSVGVIHVVLDAAAPWTYRLALPGIPALIGVQLVAQAWIGPSSNPAGVELSPAVWLSLGSW